MTDLSHFGVKGMKWGVRRPHASYTQDKQDADREEFGKRGVKRINKRLNRGKTHDIAVRNEKRLRFARRSALVLYGALMARNVLALYGPQLSASIAAKAATNRGRNLLKGIDMWQPITAKKRGGVFNISTL